LKGTALGLKVVHLRAAELPAKPQIVRTSGPTQIDVAYVLVIPELKWIAGVHISYPVPAAGGEDEGGRSAG
jgi:hypothetical protein